MVKLAAFGLVLMTLIVGWQVFGRYVLNSSPSWAEQASLMLMIWYVSLAAAAGVREGFHIRIVALENSLGKRWRDRMQLLQDIIVGFCGLAMLIWGGELVVRTWSHTIPSLGLPRGFAYGGVPLAGGLIIVFSLERILFREARTSENSQEQQTWN